MKNMLFLLIVVFVSVSSCAPDPATEQEVDTFKQIQAVNDSLDALIERANKIIEQMPKYDTMRSEYKFDSIQPLGEAPDSVSRAIGIKVVKD